MQITKKQLQKIRKEVSKGVELEEVLQAQLPDAKIAIIRGYDNFSHEAYTKGVFFYKSQARKVMDKISPNGTLADTYHIVTGTVIDLMNGKISDKRTGQSLDEVDRIMVYDSLEERLSE